MNLAIGAKVGQTAILQQPGLQRIEWLLGLLTVLAEARGTEVSAEGLELYAMALSSYPDEDIRTVVERAARTKRNEGEKAWPALGDLLEPLERIQLKNFERRRQEREQERSNDLFWQVARERIEDFGVFRFDGIEYHSLDELNQAPTRYRGTKGGEVARNSGLRL